MTAGEGARESGEPVTAPAESDAPIFPFGCMFITSTALAVLSDRDIAGALARHSRGDWGELPLEDAAANARALHGGGRLFSAYHASDGRRFWVITEADRSATTILLPEDY